jgi:hypothetical protein
MTVTTPAGRLVSAFGNADAMAKLYAPNVEWSLSASLPFPRPMAGFDRVTAFNREIWTTHYRPDCTVTILDETGDETRSAVRFIYRAHAHANNKTYENEYTLFVRSGPEGITEVFEALDTLFVMQFLEDK